MDYTQKEEFLEFVDGLHTKEKNILAMKGEEYSGKDNHVLANFQRISSMTGIPVEKVIFVYMTKHWDSVVNYMKTGNEGTEGIISRINDLRNYLAFLGFAISSKDEKKIPSF